MSETPETPFKLRVVAGPEIAELPGGVLAPAGEGLTVGRGVGADVRLPDVSVSRSHARLEPTADGWAVRDLGSTHGTFINGNRLAPNSQTALADRDQLRIGPWTLLAEDARARRSPTSLSLSEMSGAGDERVQRVPQFELAQLAQQRLDLLIDCAARVNAASDEEVMASAALESALAGTGYARAAFVRNKLDDASVEIAAHRSTAGDGPGQLHLSRTMLQEAARGEPVRLTADASQARPDYGQSIVEHGIHSALCAPVFVGSGVEAFVYLDARGTENTVQQDAAAFVQAVARISGLALANIRRQKLEREQALLTAELGAAREAQQMIMPAPSGRHGWLRYALATKPGRHVAGDLFDVVPLGDGSDAPVACFLGDVAGKGVGAAIAMATVQTYLRVSLRDDPEPARVVERVNRHLAERLSGGRFVSLWLGVIDPAAREIRFVDAGHGHWFLRKPGGRPEPVKCRGGLPLGIMPDAPYPTETCPFEPGSRVVIYSDGVTEQPGPDGVMFGTARAIEALVPASDAGEDVRALDVAVRDFARTDVLADDFTVASCEWLAQ